MAATTATLSSLAPFLLKALKFGPWAALGAAAFTGGGFLDQNVSSTADTKKRKDIVNYLQGNPSSEFEGSNILSKLSNTASDSLGLFGMNDPLGFGIVSGITKGIGSGDWFQGFAKGASNLLTGGISGIVDYVQQQERLKELNTIRQNIDPNEFSGFTNSELDALLDYYTDNKGFLFFNREDIDEDAFLRDYNDYLNWKEKVGDLPEDIDYDKIYADANDAIANENAQVMQIYNDALANDRAVLNEALQENNAAFSDYRNQVLTSQAMEQQAIAGSARNELARQQRNAISRGASAAQRLVANINTQLGLQAQSAQNALNTSNVLAQELLAHRQAQTGLRQQYSQAQNQFQNNKANLVSGTYERLQGARANARAEAQTRYNDAMDQWNKRLNAYAGDSPFADYYRNSQYRTRYGNSSSSNSSY